MLLHSLADTTYSCSPLFGGSFADKRFKVKESDLYQLWNGDSHSAALSVSFVGGGGRVNPPLVKDDPLTGD